MKDNSHNQKILISMFLELILFNCDYEFIHNNATFPSYFEKSENEWKLDEIRYD